VEKPIRFPGKKAFADSDCVLLRHFLATKGHAARYGESDMKRIFCVAAVVAAMAALAGESKANGWGTAGAPGLPSAQPMGPVAPQGDRYGYNPMLRQLMWWKKDRCSPGGNCGAGSCGAGGCGAGGMGGGMGGPGMGGPMMAFPNHPYARSPRDWFQN
jgi:hypothetical protein